MQERCNLGFDDIITPAFFDYSSQEQTPQVEVPFQLPDDAATLATFLASKAGRTFKKELKKLTKKLAKWAKHHGLNNNPCAIFIDQYTKYDGHDSGLNSLYLPLYQHGVPALLGIINLLEENTLPLDIYKAAINNLLPGLVVCPPGTHTNIVDTYMDLLARINAGIFWTTWRRKMAKQLVLEAMFAMQETHPTHPGNEMHYVNAVLNHFADALGIEMIEDIFVNTCNEAKLDSLLDDFRNKIAPRLQIEAIIDFIMTELPVTDWLSACTNTPAHVEQHLKGFERKLNFYGKEKKRFFYVDDILIPNDDYTSFDVSWRLPYVLWITVFERLRANAYVKPNFFCKKIFPSDSIKVYIMPSRTLKMAYLHDSSTLPGVRAFQPLIPYLVSLFLDKNKLWAAIQFVRKLKLQHQRELKHAIICYLHSPDYSAEEAVEKNRQLNNLISVLHILAVKLSTSVLTIIENELSWLDIRDLDNGVLVTLISTSYELIYILDKLSNDNAIVLLEQINSKELKKLCCHNITIENPPTRFLPVFMLILDRLQLSHHVIFLKLLIEDYNDLKNLLELCPEDNRTTLLYNIGEGTLTMLLREEEQIREVSNFIPSMERSTFRHLFNFIRAHILIEKWSIHHLQITDIAIIDELTDCLKDKFGYENFFNSARRAHLSNQINELSFEELDRKHFMAAMNATLKWANIHELCAAAKIGNIQRIKTLILDNKVNPNSCHSESGLSPLQIATIARRFHAAQVLEKLGGADDDLAYECQLFTRSRNYMETNQTLTIRYKPKRDNTILHEISITLYRSETILRFFITNKESSEGFLKNAVNWV